MPIDIPVADLVRQLSRVGLRPEPKLVEQILACGPEARPELLKLATDVEVLHDELPAALGPIHALRLLGEIPDVSMIAPLIAMLPIPVISEEDVPAWLVANECLQIIARCGAPAIPALWAIADNPDEADAQRGAAVAALSYIAAIAPETRDELIAECRRRLADPEAGVLMATACAVVLTELGDKESYRPIMDGYRAGRIDAQRAPAAAARQMLLGGGRPDLACAKHPLWERYQEHGPHPRQAEA